MIPIKSINNNIQKALIKISPSLKVEKSNNKKNKKKVSFELRLKLFFRLIIKVIFVIFLLIINSLIICYIVNKHFSPYPEISKPLNFYYDEINENKILTEVFINCSNQQKGRGFQCAELGATQYTLNAHFEISNKIDTNDTKNYEIETNIQTKQKEILTYKKLFFFEHQEPLTEMVNKINYLPLRIFGFFEKKKFDISLLENYENYNENVIERIKIIIKSPNINIKKAILHFQPKNKYITIIYGYFKYPFIIITFWMSLFGEILFLFFIYMCQKEAKKKIM